MSDEEFYNPQGSLPFRVCLADFGEAKIIANPDDETSGYTIRNRGTEPNKSPEMLTVGYASKKDRDTFDRRKKIGASSASDMWSLGCLFYELLTGEFLFHDTDWVRFFIRVTTQGHVCEESFCLFIYD